MAAPASHELSSGAVEPDKDDAEKTETNWTWTLYLPLILILLVVVSAGLVMYLNWKSFVDLLFKAVEANEHKAMQALLINSVLVIMIVCCLPGPGFCIILDGFFFGFVRGFALAFLAELIGYIICVCLARTCFKARVRIWMIESPLLREILTICEEDSTGKFLVLFRFLSLPVWVKNYSIGMLDISWLETILVFLPAEIFYCSIFVYIGSKGYEIADAIHKGDTEKAMHSFSGAEVGILCVSILGMLLLILLGWREYHSRREALGAGERSNESLPLTATGKLA